MARKFEGERLRDTRARTHAHAHARTHARTRTHARMRMHVHIYAENICKCMCKAHSIYIVVEKCVRSRASRALMCVF